MHLKAQTLKKYSQITSYFQNHLRLLCLENLLPIYFTFSMLQGCAPLIFAANSLRDIITDHLVYYW